jgi:hypothetical protein
MHRIDRDGTDPVRAVRARRFAVSSLIAYMRAVLVLGIAPVFLLPFQYGLYVERAAMPLAIDQYVTGITRMDAFRAATLDAKRPASLSGILMIRRLHGPFSGIEDRFADGVLGSLRIRAGARVTGIVT